MSKVTGFKIMLGDWINELEPVDILEMYVSGYGSATIKSVNNDNNGELKSVERKKIPKNKMINYDPNTTIMSFRFDKPYKLEDLPYVFINTKGIIMGESNLELMYNESNLN